MSPYSGVTIGGRAAVSHHLYIVGVYNKLSDGVTPPGAPPPCVVSLMEGHAIYVTTEHDVAKQIYRTMYIFAEHKRVYCRVDWRPLQQRRRKCPLENHACCFHVFPQPYSTVSQRARTP